MKQTYLEDYLEDGFGERDVVDDYKTDGNAPEDCKTDDGERGGCIHCRGFDGVYTVMGRKLKLHPGSLFLFMDVGVRVYADIDHVFYNCREGLIQNIRFLYDMFKHFSYMGLRVVALGKAFDDDLYLYLSNRYHGRANYRDFTVSVFDDTSLEEFKRMHDYMQIVDGDIIEEALGGG